MNNEFAKPFVTSFMSVMPQLGLADIQLAGETECGRKIVDPGVVVIIGVTGEVRGNAIFGMSEESAKSIASTMMGMPVENFDEMAQSAVSELGNMLAATACTEFAAMGITADISTPTLMYGNFNATASFDSVICIELVAGGVKFHIYVSLEKNNGAA